MEKSPTHSEPTFKGATPILPVASLGRSLKFYIGVLGFSLDWQVDESGFASVSRDGCHLFLCEGDQGHPGTWVWVGVTDVTALYGECQARGAVIRHPPTNYPWALEMQVQDPDGNVLRLGSEPLADHPIGEWLDMQGKTWVKGSDGAWSKT
jgi:predicted enzyme related to lactoylglutathione lyase